MVLEPRSPAVGSQEAFREGYIAGWRSAKGADENPDVPSCPAAAGMSMCLVGFSRGVDLHPDHGPHPTADVNAPPLHDGTPTNHQPSHLIVRSRSHPPTALPRRTRLDERASGELAAGRRSTSPLQPGQCAVGQRYRTNKALPLRLIARCGRASAPTQAGH
jgi:hypothetical protein